MCVHRQEADRQTDRCKCWWSAHSTLFCFSQSRNPVRFFTPYLGGSSILINTSLKLPIRMCPEMCLLGDFIIWTSWQWKIPITCRNLLFSLSSSSSSSFFLIYQVMILCRVELAESTDHIHSQADLSILITLKLNLLISYVYFCSCSSHIMLMKFIVS